MSERAEKQESPSETGGPSGPFLESCDNGQRLQPGENDVLLITGIDTGQASDLEFSHPLITLRVTGWILSVE